MIRYFFFFLVIFSVTACNSGSVSKAIAKENAQKGETLFNNVGCTTCHSVTGETRYGPPLNTVFNSDVVVVTNGVKRTIKANRDYIERSIQNPDFDKVDGFQSKKMPKPDLSEEDIERITDYLISLKTNAK